MNANLRQLQKKYGRLVKDISDALTNADPVSIACNRTSGVYDVEVETIIPRLKKANSAHDVHNIVYEEFQYFFGAENLNDRKEYEYVSTVIWNLWSDYIRKHT